MNRLSALAICLGGLVWCLAQESPTAELARFHHLHLNTTDPAAAIAFYTSKFDCEKARFDGAEDAVWEIGRASCRERV